MPVNISWVVLNFKACDAQTLYKLLQLRVGVFVVEQNCPYQDLDGKDQVALHILGYDNKSLVAYTRILPLGVGYKDYVAIGRVVIDPAYRKHGLGQKLMEKSIAECQKHYPQEPIKISAQAHLKEFYSRLGFCYKGEDYLEDDIPHCAMYLPG